MAPGLVSSDDRRKSFLEKNGFHMRRFPIGRALHCGIAAVKVLGLILIAIGIALFLVLVPMSG